MTIRFLIDECLSPALRRIAMAHGHHESTCVRDRGWSGKLDHELMQKVLAEDFTLVTNNSVDFRGSGPGSLGGLHSRTEIHCGLVCLDAESGMDLDIQRALFDAALDVIEQPGFDLVNRALELFLFDDGTIECLIYDIPSPGTDGIGGVITRSLDIGPYLERVADGKL